MAQTIPMIYVALKEFLEDDHQLSMIKFEVKVAQNHIFQFYLTLELITIMLLLDLLRFVFLRS